VILCDAGPLVALYDRGDRDHVLCRHTLAGLGQELMRTTWPCLAEAMHLLGRAGGAAVQDKLWRLAERKLLRIEGPYPSDWDRLRDLMRKYSSLPMDLGDASMVVVAEHTGLNRIFSLDKDFRVYLIHDRDPFDVVP